MRQYNARFEKHIDNKIASEKFYRSTDRPGIILSYNPKNNTATVALTEQDSDRVGDIIRDVACPTYHGLQLSAPKMGRFCYVAFKGGRESQPVITHYYNDHYEKFDYEKMSNSHSSIPKYLTY